MIYRPGFCHHWHIDSSRKKATGIGEKIDISMLDCQASLLNYMATMHLISGKDPEPIGNEHPVHSL